jgi:guanylate kinase
MFNIFIISGPSGAGEDSTISGLKKHFDICRVITSTTRPMRPGESEGHPYHFVTPEIFQENIKNNLMAEYAQEYNGNYYGVTTEELNRVAKSGKIGIWKIEFKGVITAKKKFPEIKSIYIAPPSLEILKQRITRRNPNVTEKYLQERMEYTKEWMKHEDIYDYKIVNEEGKLEETIKKAAGIIRSNLDVQSN